MGFTHFDEVGNAIMVDVGYKEPTKRTASACGGIRMTRECLQMVADGEMKKGDVLAVARIAGIQGAKRTSELIPLCHGLNLTHLEIVFDVQWEESLIEARCTASCYGSTGVEMEALTGVSVALLTIYDMCKAVDKSMTMEHIHLLEKHGGKSGDFVWKEC